MVSARIIVLAAISGDISSAREMATACADLVTKLDMMLRHFVDNNSGQVAIFGDDGGDHERRRWKAQLADNTAKCKKVNTSRKLWMVRWRDPPNLGDPPADLKSFVRQVIHLTVASGYMRSAISDVGMDWTRLDGMVGHSVLVDDRFDLLRLAFMVALSVVLSTGVDDDLPCPTRVAAFR